MITRVIKLKPTKKQEARLEEILYLLAGVHNWTLRKIELDAKDKIYHTAYGLQKLTVGHSKKIGVPAQVFAKTIENAYKSWERCFKKKARKPKLKSSRNRLRSFLYPQYFKIDSKNITLNGLGSLKYHKQDIPEGKHKQFRIVKKSTGWYCQIFIDANPKFKVKRTNKKVGIDTGFKHLAVLSDGTKIKNPKFLKKTEKRIAQAQRGKNYKLVGRLCAKVANQRRDYAHKVSRQIVENYKEIYIVNDKLVKQAKRFGKSVADAGIGQLRAFIVYKGNNNGRLVKYVNSFNTTKTCNKCGSLKGPTGLQGLSVRVWVCPDCGSEHDRDINSALLILKLGLGASLDLPKSSN